MSRNDQFLFCEVSPWGTYVKRNQSSLHAGVQPHPTQYSMMVTKPLLGIELLGVKVTLKRGILLKTTMLTKIVHENPQIMWSIKLFVPGKFLLNWSQVTLWDLVSKISLSVPCLVSTSTSKLILSRTEYQYNAQSARNNKLIDKKCWKMPLIND